MIAELRYQPSWRGPATQCGLAPPASRLGAAIPLRHLRGLKVKVGSGIALNYQTNVTPPADAEKRIESNWNAMEKNSGEVLEQPLRRKQLPPYGFPQLQKVLERYVLRFNVDLAFFDITCFTKIHTLALAVSLASSVSRLKWVLAYTPPENYTNFEDSADQGPGWKHVILAPLGATAFLFNESGGRGILLPGHEADRLVVALAEIEPVGGLIVMADTEGRPDLRLVSERRNQKVLRHLTKLGGARWMKKVIGVGDLQAMRDCVQREIVRAKGKNAPVILFPYGPSLLYSPPRTNWRDLMPKLPGSSTRYLPDTIQTIQKALKLLSGSCSQI